MPCMFPFKVLIVLLLTINTGRLDTNYVVIQLSVNWELKQKIKSEQKKNKTSINNLDSHTHISVSLKWDYTIKVWWSLKYSPLVSQKAFNSKIRPQYVFRRITFLWPRPPLFCCYAAQSVHHMVCQPFASRELKVFNEQCDPVLVAKRFSKLPHFHLLGDDAHTQQSLSLSLFLSVSHTHTLTCIWLCTLTAQF